MTTSKARQEVIIKGQRANRSAFITNWRTCKKKKTIIWNTKIQNWVHKSTFFLWGECVCDRERKGERVSSGSV